VAHPRAGLTVDEVRAIVESALRDRPPGDDLGAVDRSLVRLAVASATTALDLEGTRAATVEALALGVPPDQLTEVLTLVAALGMHTLHEGVRELREVLEAGPSPTLLEAPLDDARLALRATHETGSSYWARLERELPGFLDGLLRLSPPAYAGFFEFCAIAWRHGSLPPLTRELVYLAIDATPTHRYGPGLRLHLDNALRLGASPAQIRQVLDIAAGGGAHEGIR
jgi:alkylhydroperoxidase/carboxymuconolactone decarboxylase family protein YurZ